MRDGLAPRSLPDNLLEHIRNINLNASDIENKNELKLPLANGSIKLGGRVNHDKFGIGTVVTIEGQGESARIQVNFDDGGSKWLVLAYANLQPT